MRLFQLKTIVPEIFFKNCVFTFLSFSFELFTVSHEAFIAYDSNRCFYIRMGPISASGISDLGIGVNQNTLASQGYLKGQCHKILDPRFVSQFLLMWDHNSCAQAFSQKVSISQRCLHLVNLR